MQNHPSALNGAAVVKSCKTKFGGETVTKDCDNESNVDEEQGKYDQKVLNSSSSWDLVNES